MIFGERKNGGAVKFCRQAKRCSEAHFDEVPQVTQVTKILSPITRPSLATLAFLKVTVRETNNKRLLEKTEVKKFEIKEKKLFAYN